MHVRQRQEFDGDREGVVATLDYMTERFRYEVHCGSCNRSLFANKDAFDMYNHSMEQGLDSPYICSACTWVDLAER